MSNLFLLALCASPQLYGLSIMSTTCSHDRSAQSIGYSSVSPADRNLH